MKQIKNIVAALLVLCMALSLCACGSDAETVETTEAPTEAIEVTEAPQETEAVDSDQTMYTVTVTDEDGNPIAGAMVQLCVDTCYPGITNESGVAQFSVQEDDYKVSFLSLPAGYTYSGDAQEFYFEDGSTDITIALKAAE